MRFADMEKAEAINPGNAAITPSRFQTKLDDRPYAEPDPKSMSLNVLEDNLGNCLNIIEDEVMKGYVTRLNQLPIVQPEAVIGQKLGDIHFFRISELVYQEDEFSADKLAMVFHTLSNKPCTLVLMLRSDGEKTDFYLGARPNGSNSAGTLFQMLKQSLLGFFPGSRISEYYDEDMRKDLVSAKVGCISSVTCIADYKQNEKWISDKEFIQGLEKFVYTMGGKSYTAILIADSVENNELLWRKHEYEQIYTQISPFANMQMNFSVSDGGSLAVGNSEGSTRSIAHTDTKGISASKTEGSTYSTGTNETTGSSDTLTDTHTESNSVSNGKTHTKGTTDGTSRTVTNGFNVGMYAGGAGGGVSAGISAGYSHSVSKGTSHTDSVSDSITKTLTHGFSNSSGTSHSNSKSSGKTEGRSISASKGVVASENTSDSISDAFNLVNTMTLTDSFGTSRSIALNSRNMTLGLALERIEKHLERIEECESFGMWNFAAYFLGETAAETETAANIYKSVMAGTDSGIERSAINSWVDEEAVKSLLKYIQSFVHPRFVYKGFSYEEDRYVAVDPSALVSTNELAIHMGMPRHSVRGLPVVEHAQFAQEVIVRQENKAGKIRLGNIYNLGQKTSADLELDVESLTMHTFVTGSTGSGKSNTIYKLLSELRKKDVAFLVIEPAKGEYKSAFGSDPDVQIYGTNPNLKEAQMLRINPFRFPAHIHVLEHLDRLIEIFNVCWPMYAAMPAILKDSVERAYVECGWDLELSENRYDSRLFPNFRDVVKQIRLVLKESDYSNDNKGDYTGSLVTRLRSLTNGINGLIFTTDDVEDSRLFDENSIVDLSRVGSAETKSLIMGFLVLKLQEYRMEQRSVGAGINERLRHVTVLEEAHNLLKRVTAGQGGEGANMLGKSVEMLANSIAEMRTYGEGFIIADQSPGLLDMSAIRNTNTKIILRLPDIGDRELVGKAAGLNDKQITELTKLEKGVAAVSQSDWLEPVLCQVDRFDESELFFLPGQKDRVFLNGIDNLEVSKSLLECIMNKGIYRKGDKADLLKLKDAVLKSKLDSSVKCDFFKYLNSDTNIAVSSLRKLIYDFLKAENAIDASRHCRDIVSWVHSVAEKLEPDITLYPSERIDLIMALLINEKALQDESYNDILNRFTEVYEMKGGVY